MIEGISDCSRVMVLMLLLLQVSSTINYNVFEYVIDYSMALVSTTIDSSYSYSIATL